MNFEWDLKKDIIYTEKKETIRIISARVADENERRIYNGERNIEGWTKAN